MTVLSRVCAWRRARQLRADRLEALYGMNRRNVELIYRYNPRRYYPVADDKLLAKEYLSRHGVPVPETLAVCRGLFEVEATLEALSQQSELVIKPASGSGGDGIVVLGEREASGWQTSGAKLMSDAELRQHLAQIVFGAFTSQLEDKALIERRVVSHEMFHELWADGVSDIRVLVLAGKPLLAMLRVPTQRSRGKANLHQGGLGVAVDIASGHTTRAVCGRLAVERHPESGVPLLGRQIPDWAGVIDLALRAAASVPLGYLGVDVVVDRQRGPLVLEINARPGLEIQNVNAIALGSVVPPHAGDHE